MRGTRFANSLILRLARQDFKRFRDQTSQARDVQLSILSRIVSRNAQTEFGIQHGFAGLADYGEYAAAVPVRSYEEFWPYIRKITCSNSQVLTKDRTLLLEPTSGSTHSTKLIPYTRTLKREFHAAINPWLFDIYQSRPELRHGRSYWSVSPPVTRVRSTETTVPVGFDADSAYLSRLSRFAAERTFVTPDSLKAECDSKTFFRRLSLFLLVAEDLSLVSVWNPTAFLLLLDHIRDQRSALVTALEEPSSPAVSGERRRKLSRTLDRDPVPFHEIWPSLTFLSCWADGANASYAAQLQALFPKAEIQGKGLIATEGIISIPFGEHRYLPAYQSHFLEFLPRGETDKPLLLHEIEAGEQYQIVITTSGGLYRYRLGDIVTVTGHHNGLPLIQFVTRDNVLDHFGEKLHVGNVDRAVKQAVASLDTSLTFVLFGFESDGNTGCYCLYVEPADATNTHWAAALDRVRSQLTALLEENYHYAHARNLRQLQPLKVFQIASGGLEVFYRRLREMGVQTGDIKTETVSLIPDWSKWFDGGFVDST